MTSNPQLEFISSHHPPLDDGDYTIEISQTVSGTGISDANTIPTLTRHFSVFGERFSLKPSDIHAVFPPDRSFGDHATVLPHIILNRNTLPWERKIEKTAENAPWLALLLFTEDELKSVQPKVVTVSELKKASANPSWPKLVPEAGQADQESVTVIDIPLATAKKLVPSGAELPHLAHARQVSGEKEASENSERAAIIGSRLPVGQKVMIAHLVSLENRYVKKTVNGKDSWQFNWPPQNVQTVRFVTLKSWSFQCKSAQHTFGGLLRGLDAGALNRPSLTKIGQALPQFVQEIAAEFDSLTMKIAKLEKKFDGLFYHGKDMRAVYNEILPLREKSQIFFTALKAVRQHQFQAIPVRPLFMSQQEAKLVTDVLGYQQDAFTSALRQKILRNQGPLIPVQNGTALAPNGNKLVQLTLAEVATLIEQLSTSSHIPQNHQPMIKHVLARLVQPNKHFLLEKVGNALKDVYPQTLMGKIALPHKMRSGSGSYCWYAGPLAPFDYDTSAAFVPTKGEFPQKTADNLLRYDKTYGLFDVTYAAAWELGRLLALKDKAFSVELYKWKRAHSQALRQVEEQELHPHKPHTTHPQKVLLMPKAIEAWLSRLSILQGVPYNYLVPDDTMLPKESLRFFTVDPRWIACLIDGAFSIGRVTETDFKNDAIRKKQITTVPVSGFLMRSAVVSGWPSLKISGYRANGKAKLPLLRIERLSPNVLLCLFEGSLKKLSIHEQPETIHFGFDPDHDRSTSPYVKKLRTKTGKEKADIKIQSVSAKPNISQFVIEADSKRVKMDTLFTAIENQINANLQGLGFGDAQIKLNGAQFAMEMVAGVSEVAWSLP